jgi:hypothetical protein
VTHGFTALQVDDRLVLDSETPPEHERQDISRAGDRDR